METFVIPEAKIQTATQYVPGIDGQKMSKSKKHNRCFTRKNLRNK